MTTLLSVMLAALTGVVTPITLPTPSAPAGLCRYIDTWRGTNVPVTPGLASTDIVHALAIAKQGQGVGWLVLRRDGKAWYFDGPDNGKIPVHADSVNALKSLGLERFSHRDVGQGGMISLRGAVDLTRLANAGFGVYTCY